QEQCGDQRNGDGDARCHMPATEFGDPVTRGFAPKVHDPSASSYIVVNDRSGLEMVGAALGDTDLVGLDLETTGLHPRTDRIRLLSLALDTIDGGTLVSWVDCFAVDPSPLWEALADRELVLHNAAFDLAFLAQLGFMPTGKVYDTMLLAQLLTAGIIERVS